MIICDGYVSPEEMLARFYAKELVERCDDTRRVTPELMQAAIECGDMSAEDADTQAAVTAALSRLRRACEDANSEISVALDTGGVGNVSEAGETLLKALGCDIALFLLAAGTVIQAGSEDVSGEKNLVYLRSRQARDRLRDIAAGKLTIGVRAGAAATGYTGLPSVSAPPRVFARSTLDRY
jgi:phage gp36-like protein